MASAHDGADGQTPGRRGRVSMSAREVFAILGQRGLLTPDLVVQLQHMVGFRNIAVHEYDTLDMTIAVRVITHDIDSLRQLAGHLLQRYLSST
ncbi:DUF86 domain-containing protein [Hydrogenophaga sp. PBL-H3]|nr:DUF86 domain-containing protein [Hydrogenophaga sp. PBL-H3]QHE81597.1 DUF86 domain-containing protein [Hydrogenophaga sp. PBL-H3]